MADEIPYVRELAFEYGRLAETAPNVRRIVAHNPSPFTHVGTGTYVVGRGRVAVIDPGPRMPDHVAGLLRELALHGEEVAHILVTHTHLDHSGAAQLLAAETGAPMFGFGPHGHGHNQTRAEGDKVEAGADWEFVPDHVLSEGDTLEGKDYQITALHTPGHCSNHLCFALADGKTLFTGDHVMGWATSVIVPPDGDMGHYLANLERLLLRDDARYLPTHGPNIEAPKPLVAAYLQHRRAREAQVLGCLERGLSHIADIVSELYASVPRSLHPAAARSVHAHVLHLLAQDRVVSEGEPNLDAAYRLRRA
jgi:glyoxylase-like metal-dependent hydrolase (beta-lactamase superfamily II)